MGKQIGQVPFTVPAAMNNWRLGDFLKAQGVSSSYLRKVKREQPGITLKGVHRNTDCTVQTGECYFLPLYEEEENPAMTGEEFSLHICYESAFSLVVEKPAGMAVHPTLGYRQGTLANGVIGLYHSRGETIVFRPVNRLDAGTGGLVLIAKNGLAAPFLSRSVQKIYTAVIAGQLLPKSGIWQEPIARSEGSVIKRCVSDTGKPAKTCYQVRLMGKNSSLVDFRLMTGRTHQIRVHCAYHGHPLMGDFLYGTEDPRLKRPALHCRKLTFCEPDGKRVSVRSKLPPDFHGLL